MESSASQVQFPALREEVLEHVRALADNEYQWSVWIRREFPRPNYYDDLGMTLNNLADTQALEWPYESVGSVLRDEREAIAMSKINAAIYELFNRNGSKFTDEQYLKTPEWWTVVEAADAALRVLSDTSV